MRRPGVVEVWMNVVRSHFTPDIITAKVGDKIIVHLTNVEQTPDATHGFAVPTKNVMVSLDPGETHDGRVHRRQARHATASTAPSSARRCTSRCRAG